MPERPSVINCAFGSSKEGKTWQFQIFLRRPSVPVREIQQNSADPCNFCSTLHKAHATKKVSNPPLPQQRNFSRLEAERRSLRLAAAGGGGGGA